jgi:hypothetical protein
LIKALAQYPSERVFLTLSDSHVLVYGYGQSERTTLSTNIDRARAMVSLHAFTIETSWIDSPQSLQDKIRRIFDGDQVGPSGATERQVH